VEECPFIGDAGVEALAESLAHHPTLQGLDLGGTSFRERGANALAVAIMKNRLAICEQMWLGPVLCGGWSHLARCRECLHTNLHHIH
jgi:hypothetical protein